ncbi:MAG: hypothetical protein K9I94_02140 [Bacteroidales bacterium]|nr:hypothetical protein [Bacteroidales bacterium]
MMKKAASKLKAYLLILLLGSVGITKVMAQSNDGGWSVGLDGGLMVFYGDVKNYDFLPITRNRNELRGGLSLSVYKQLNPYLHMNAKLLEGKLAGANRAKNLFFESQIREYSISVLININDILFYYNDKTHIMAYAIIGSGLTDYRSIKYTLEDREILDVTGYTADGKEKTEMTTELVIPLGLGMAYQFSETRGFSNEFMDHIDMIAELRWYWANTDNFDLDQSIRAGQDKYSYLSVGVRYHF